MHFLELHGPQSLTQFDGFWWDSAHQHFVVLRNGAFRALCAAPNDRRGDGCAGGRFAVVAGACFVAEAARGVALAKYSLDMKLLAMQTSATALLVYDLEQRKRWRVECKSGSVGGGSGGRRQRPFSTSAGLQ